MKKIKSKIKGIDPLLMPVKEVKRLMRNWQRCLPILLGDLFTMETPQGILRYDTYSLNKSNIKFIKSLNNLYSGDNVKGISVIMGKKDLKVSKKSNEFNPSNSIFLPILLVELKTSYEGNLYYYFPTDPVNKIFNLNESIAKRTKIHNALNPGDAAQRLSPKVAELFIVNWQSLGDTELISSFDCLSPDGTIEIKSGNPSDPDIVFSEQKLLRVKQYNYDEMETKAIFDNLNQSKQNKFFISLGAGLSVADYHPFNFRPIIRIEQPIPKNRLADDEDLPEYYDTSRPCPPWCKPGE